MKKKRKISKKDVGDLLGIGGGTIAVGGMAIQNPIVVASGAALTGGTMGVMVLDEFLKKRRAKRRK